MTQLPDGRHPKVMHTAQPVPAGRGMFKHQTTGKHLRI